ncbi:unnamed protein product [Musa acuminata subsp. malaccensis]|uniref:(wild Malaysian banana) hypothetical protein n=1 Tax=Musa acuminata subsp. malaccensis TaxID=214687 RepID=A0A8D7A475_MUSAM|nr:unnamed protein product [Musa acuminata subsp. malaccensis]
MASDLARSAKEAFVDDDFELAVDLNTRALELDPANADLYADRAQANIKLNNFTEAVADANKAIELAPTMSKAYLRKGTACIKLEEYQTAKAALEAGFFLAPTDSRFTRLIKECDEHIAEEINRLPKQGAHAASPIAVISSHDGSIGSPKESVPIHDASCHQSVKVSSKPKYRHDHYNTPTEVVLTIFAKDIPEKYVNIDFGEQIISVTIDIPGEDTYLFQHRLFAKVIFQASTPKLQFESIVPEKCRYEIFSSKIEIRLFKAEAITWTSLEFSKDKKVVQKVNVSGRFADVKSERPSYPSSKTKVDWDKLESEVKKEEKEEKLDGDAALNKLFRDIYQGGDEDMKRAMMKSFVESNGSVLSTNWKDVGSRKVEGTPPDGMEMKK